MKLNLIITQIESMRKKELKNYFKTFDIRYLHGELLLRRVIDELTKKNEYQKIYAENQDIKRYVDRYCQMYKVTIEEAFRHRVVVEYCKYKLEGK